MPRTVEISNAGRTSMTSRFCEEHQLTREQLFVAMPYSFLAIDEAHRRLAPDVQADGEIEAEVYRILSDEIPGPRPASVSGRGVSRCWVEGKIQNSFGGRSGGYRHAPALTPAILAPYARGSPRGRRRGAEEGTWRRRCWWESTSAGPSPTWCSSTRR